MKGSMAILLRYEEGNKYSLNAVVGALERHPFYTSLDILPLGRREDFGKHLASASASHSKVLVCCSFYSNQSWQTARFLQAVKPLALGDITFVAGGPHASALPAQTLAMGFDAVVVGEAEHSFPGLVRALLKDEPLSGVPAVASLDSSGSLAVGPPAQPVNLDDFTGFALLTPPRFGPLEISRGCPFGCRFCQTTYFAGSQMRHRSLESVRRCVALMVAEHLNDIRVLTPNAFGYGSPDGRKCDEAAVKALLETVSSQLKPHNRFFFGSFPSEVRPEHVTPRLVELVKRHAHNDNLVIGAQTGSPKMLRHCCRGHTVEHVVEAVRITRAAGMRALVDFIFGLPGETQEDIQLSLQMMQHLTDLGATLHVHAFMPLPGTPWAFQTPQGIHPEVRRRLLSMIPRGLVFGQWQRQERDALHVHRCITIHEAQSIAEADPGDM